MQRTNATKGWFFGKINRTGKPLDEVTVIEDANKIRDEALHKRITKHTGSFEHIPRTYTYSSKLENLEIGKFLDTNDLLGLSHKDISSLSRSIMIKETNFPSKTKQGSERFTVEL